MLRDTSNLIERALLPVSKDTKKEIRMRERCEKDLDLKLCVLIEGKGYLVRVRRKKDGSSELVYWDAKETSRVKRVSYPFTKDMEEDEVRKHFKEKKFFRDIACQYFNNNNSVVNNKKLIHVQKTKENRVVTPLKPKRQPPPTPKEEDVEDEDDKILGFNNFIVKKDEKYDALISERDSLKLELENIRFKQKQDEEEKSELLDKLEHFVPKSSLVKMEQELNTIRQQLQEKETLLEQKNIENFNLKFKMGDQSKMFDNAKQDAEMRINSVLRTIEERTQELEVSKSENNKLKSANISQSSQLQSQSSKLLELGEKVEQLEELKTRYETELADLRPKFKTSQNLHNQLKMENIEHLEKLETQQEELALAQKQIEAWTKFKADYDQKFDDMRDSFGRSMKKLEKEKKMLKSDLANTNEKLATAEHERVQYKKEMEKLQGELSLVKKDCLKLGEENSENQENIERLQNEIQQVRKQSNSEKIAVNQILEEKGETIQKQNSQLQTLKAKLWDLETERDNLTTERDELSSYVEELLAEEPNQN